MKKLGQESKVKSQNIIIDLFFGDEMMKFQNDIIHAGDIFEKNKHLAKYACISIVGTPDLDKLCMNIKKSYEKAGGYVLFACIRDFNKNNSPKYPYYLKEGIQSISNGTSFYVFKDALVHLGYTPEYDEHLIITKIL
jgi:hypothetical protein